MKKSVLLLIGIVIILILISINCLPDTPQEPATTTTTIRTGQSENDKVIAYKCVGSDATYYVFINSDTVIRGFNVADGLTGAVCIVDGKTAGTTPIDKPVGVRLSSDKKKVYLDPLTSAIFKK